MTQLGIHHHQTCRTYKYRIMQYDISILYYADVNNLCFYIYHSSVMSVLLHSAHYITNYKDKIHIRIEDKIKMCFNAKSANANEL